MTAPPSGLERCGSCGHLSLLHEERRGTRVGGKCHRWDGCPCEEFTPATEPTTDQETRT